MSSAILSTLNPAQVHSATQPFARDTDVAVRQIEKSNDDGELREAFGQFVGETFFRQMLSAMRKTVDKPAYFHGGQAEEMFRGQLDQLLAEKMSDASSDSFTDSMFNLFQLKRM